jgi:hypothetical protein
MVQHVLGRKFDVFSLLETHMLDFGGAFKLHEVKGTLEKTQ